MLRSDLSTTEWAEHFGDVQEINGMEVGRNNVTDYNAVMKSYLSERIYRLSRIIRSLSN